MKTRVLNLGVFLALLPAQLLLAQPAAPSEPAGSAPAKDASPHIQFATLVYDFGKVSSGELVKYQFVFTNTGDAVLVVSDVHPGCGCTTAGEWTKQVEPGKTGTIPIQFNSGNYNGPVTKSVTVTCNDKTQPTTALQFKGTVWKPIEVLPQNAILNVAAESQSNATTTLRIVNHLDEPITFSDPECNNHAFAAEVKTVEPGKEFQLVVTAVPPFGQGNVQGNISLKTSSAKMPVLNVMALAMIQPAIVVSPPRIFLAAGPLTNGTTMGISIRNNGTNLLTLSDPLVNADGVDVKVKENEPGRQFALTVTFPPGFEAPAGELALSVKSSNRGFPVIKVPIFQTARPMAVAARPRAFPSVLTNRPPTFPPASTH